MRQPAPLSLAITVAGLLLAACADPTTAPRPKSDAASAALLPLGAELHTLTRPQNEVYPTDPDPTVPSVIRASAKVRLREDGKVEFTLLVDNPNREEIIM